MKISQPTFLVDLKKCRRNIDKFITIANKHRIELRPHFKTHQSTLIGDLFRSAGITKITVSSVPMAEWFASQEWKDITIAFPLNILELKKINNLAGKITLNLLIDNRAHIDALQNQLHKPVGIFTEIDTGDHRTGIAAEDIDKIASLVNQINSSEITVFKGFLTHAGHTYHAKNKQEIHQIHDQTIKQMENLKTLFQDHYPLISIGNTPSCSQSDNFAGVDEFRPGNFVYYDLTQLFLGACKEEEIAVVLAAPIVSKNRKKYEITIHGGGVHLSKEFLKINDQQIYGKPVLLQEKGWSKSLDNCIVTKLSQEHGTIKVSGKYVNQLNIGDVIGILPVHSCMTANLMKATTRYITQ